MVFGLRRCPVFLPALVLLERRGTILLQDTNFTRNEDYLFYSPCEKWTHNIVHRKQKIIVPHYLPRVSWLV